jgi:peptidoglycan biosynthesis protein MviN/MurJ (putative lipid II flippase)
MKKINLLDRTTVFTISRFSDEILEVIYNRDHFTTSDLQGRVEAIVINILDTEIEGES